MKKNHAIIGEIWKYLCERSEKSKQYFRRSASIQPRYDLRKSGGNLTPWVCFLDRRLSRDPSLNFCIQSVGSSQKCRLQIVLTQHLRVSFLIELIIWNRWLFKNILGNIFQIWLYHISWVWFRNSGDHRRIVSLGRMHDLNHTRPAFCLRIPAPRHTYGCVCGLRLKS